MKLHIKIMPDCKHHVSTGHAISKEFYRGNIEFVETGQGNKCMRHKSSCLITRQSEIRSIGIYFLLVVTMMEVLNASVSFAGNTDLASNGNSTSTDMQLMLDLRNELCKAT